jgi:hypothetical protein
VSVGCKASSRQRIPKSLFALLVLRADHLTVCRPRRSGGVNDLHAGVKSDYPPKEVVENECIIESIGRLSDPDYGRSTWA